MSFQSNTASACHPSQPTTYRQRHCTRQSAICNGNRRRAGTARRPSSGPCCCCHKFANCKFDQQSLAFNHHCTSCCPLHSNTNVQSSAVIRSCVVYYRSARYNNSLTKSLIRGVEPKFAFAQVQFFLLFEVFSSNTTSFFLLFPSIFYSFSYSIVFLTSAYQSSWRFLRRTIFRD